MENIRYVDCDFCDRMANLENDIASEKWPKNQHTPSSKLTILVSSCSEKNSIRNNAHKCFMLSLVFLKLLIESVAFFLGHPV